MFLYLPKLLTGVHHLSKTDAGYRAAGLAFTDKHMVPLAAGCLTVAVALGLGTGAMFKLVALWFPGKVGAVTGVVGAAGGLGGFFPPLVMALVKTLTGTYTSGSSCSRPWPPRA